MLNIPSDLLPCGEAQLRAALVDYQAALEAHKSTIDVPAPWPQHEILRDIVAAGGEFQVIYPPLPPAPERAPGLFNHLKLEREA